MNDISRVNEPAITTILRLIRMEGERTHQSPTIARLRPSVAAMLCAMTAKDWYDASEGFADMPICQAIADGFITKGLLAAHGLRFGPLGPTLEVATSHDVPDIQIIVGVPDDSEEMDDN